MSKRFKNYAHNKLALKKLEAFCDLMIDKRLDSAEKIMVMFNCEYPIALNLFHRRFSFIANSWINEKYSFLKKKRMIKQHVAN